MDLLQRNVLPRVLILSLSVMAMSSAYANNTEDPVTHLGPPDVSLVDRMGVDMTSGIMSASVTDVLIGGNMGLSHSIMTTGGKFNTDTPQYRGFQDSYFGTISGGKMTWNNDDLSDDQWILIVSDGRESARFRVTGSTGNYVFTDMRDTSSAYDDERHTLAQTSSSVALWTKADGTKVTYHTYGSLGPNFGTKARMTSIEYPDGFMIHIDYGSQYQLTSVSTNTGYQLKYIFENDTRPITTSQQNYINTTTFGDQYTHSSLIWSQSVPKYVVALNNAHQSCGLSTTTCSYASHWPKATYEWPAGMPRVSYLPDPVNFVVRDAENRATTFTMKGFDVSVEQATGPNGYWGGIEPGEIAVSRITHVIPPSGKTTEYFYENILEITSHTGFSINGHVRHAILTKAKQGIDELVYLLDTNNAQGDLVNYRSWGRQSMEAMYINQATESIAYFRNWDVNVNYTGNVVNDIAIVTNKFNKTTTEFDYDTRGNVEFVTQMIGQTEGPKSEAKYPITCTISTQKYCNKPSYTIDPNGNRTDYTYHPQSGNIATVTLPANKHGVRAKTTYGYNQYTASHGGPYASPIWLLSSKTTCATAQTCPAGQEIVTTYEYEPTNLQLAGEVVTADGESLRTCYEYDMYGNQTAVLPPKDNIGKSTCVN